ncbi:hypothetical protein VTH06DRAFT_1470 [Thermothelomyces fergusii]
MSGSGGFYKYRCKYFYTYNCPNWVYCNGHACAMCLAEGRDAIEAEATAPATWQPQQPQQQQQQPQQQQQQVQQQPVQQHLRRPNAASAYTEICVPQAIHGTLRYTVMEIIPTDDPGPGAYWVLRQKVMAAQALPYSTFTTSDTPRPVMTPTGVGGQVAY